jgi:hypothetical protein
MKIVEIVSEAGDRPATLSATSQFLVEAPPHPLSSRAKPRDLQFHLTPNQCWVPHGPDFLRRLAALIHCMRLSLMKGALADLSSTAWQEIGSSPLLA